MFLYVYYLNFLIYGVEYLYFRFYDLICRWWYCYFWWCDFFLFICVGGGEVGVCVLVLGGWVFFFLIMMYLVRLLFRFWLGVIFKLWFYFFFFLIYDFCSLINFLCVGIWIVVVFFYSFFYIGFVIFGIEKGSFFKFE